MSRAFIIFITSLFIVIRCHLEQGPANPVQPPAEPAVFKTVAEIPLPPGYKRIAMPAGSFGEWLRQIPLKKDSRVYLYNGSLKRNQSAQFAVLDISVGKKDLQQCADAILRLRAEYFFKQKQNDHIVFKATDGTILSFPDWLKGVRYKLRGTRLSAYKQITPDTDPGKSLESFLETVFSYCGTLSLDNETRSISLQAVRPGDMFVKGGSPGHAMIVMDVAVNEAGQKIFMLAQSYMPAQDIHIVKNPVNDKPDPWYMVKDSTQIVTPEWTFEPGQIKRW